MDPWFGRGTNDNLRPHSPGLIFTSTKCTQPPKEHDQLDKILQEEDSRTLNQTTEEKIPQSTLRGTDILPLLDIDHRCILRENTKMDRRFEKEVNTEQTTKFDNTDSQFHLYQIITTTKNPLVNNTSTTTSTDGIRTSTLSKTFM